MHIHADSPVLAVRESFRETHIDVRGAHERKAFVMSSSLVSEQRRLRTACKSSVTHAYCHFSYICSRIELSTESRLLFLLCKYSHFIQYETVAMVLTDKLLLFCYRSMSTNWKLALSFHCLSTKVH